MPRTYTPTKTRKVKKMLERQTGCTRQQILDVTGWKAVSVQKLARNAGLYLQVDRRGGPPFRYFGECKSRHG